MCDAGDLVPFKCSFFCFCGPLMLTNCRQMTNTKELAGMHDFHYLSKRDEQLAESLTSFVSRPNPKLSIMARVKMAD